MSGLDTLIRDGLAESVRTVSDPSVDALAERLERARRSTGSDGRRWWVVAVAAAAVGVLVLSAVVFRAAGDPTIVDVTPGTEPTTTEPSVRPGPVEPGGPSGFAEWGSGWHDLDTGPVPAGTSSVVWAGDRLVAMGPAGGWSYSPSDGRWAAMPVPDDLVSLTMVWTGTEIVAVGNLRSGAAVRAATWHPGDDQWRDAGEVPIAPALAALGGIGPGSSSGGPALLWTGERVIHPSRAVAFDPANRTWSAMPLPDDLIAFTGVVQAKPVMVGGELVIQPASDRAKGLAWNSTGSRFREVDGVDPAVMASFTPAGLVPRTVAAVEGDRLVLVTGEQGFAVAQDVVTGRWERLDPVPGTVASEGCPTDGIATVAGHVVVERCTDGSPVVLDGTQWRSNARHPMGATGTWGRWISSGDALVVWGTDTDHESYIWAYVWVP